ncbi:hypothetical protein [Herbidospora mongoliensis]|uniref:hypothetical protein n=1 Tax=Herbidospora mongoliensis TaxID=688067 RepID=UPI0008317900|nr:hypothetical protein [Herbidospora mongoliensis]
MLADFIKRQPLLARLIVAIAVVAIVRVLNLLGWVPADWVVDEQDVQDWLTYVAGIWAFWSARRKVTPVAAPKDDGGRRLVPEVFGTPLR